LQSEKVQELQLEFPGVHNSIGWIIEHEHEEVRQVVQGNLRLQHVWFVLVHDRPALAGDQVNELWTLSRQKPTQEEEKGIQMRQAQMQMS
jgi:hypothetical protein